MGSIASGSGRANGGQLAEKIRQARLVLAEQFAAIDHLRDAATMRLQVLKDELAPVFANDARAQSVIDLALVPGDPPRLWIGMTSYVIMAPDPSTYRFRRDTSCGHEIVLESKDRTEIAEAIVSYAAVHLVARERQLNLMSGGAATRTTVIQHRTSVIVAWLSGVTFGACLVLALLYRLIP